MAIVKLDIYNMALTHLGMKNLLNLTDVNPSLTACNTFYEPCRDDVFSESKWPFADVSEALVVTTDTILGWDYVYTYPANAATVWSVYDEGTVDNKDAQKFETKHIVVSNKRVICSNLESAYADYTYKVTDPAIYSPKFILALSYRLAAAMAHTLVGSAEIGITLTNLSNAIISEAKRISSSEKLNSPTKTSSYVNSRG